jgi:hypothetical protein
MAVGDEGPVAPWGMGPSGKCGPLQDSWSYGSRQSLSFMGSPQFATLGTCSLELQQRWFEDMAVLEVF